MKLSQLTTGQAADVLLQITPSIANITHDQNALNAIGLMTDFEGLNVRGAQMKTADRYANFVTVLLRDHRADVFNILAALNLSAPEEIEAQPLTETMRQMKEIMDDKELADFLSSFLPLNRKTQSPPSSSAED